MNPALYVVIEGANLEDKRERAQVLARSLRSQKIKTKLFLRNEYLPKLQSNLRVGQPDQPPSVYDHIIDDTVLTLVDRDIKDYLKRGYVCVADYGYLSALAMSYYGYGVITDYQQILDIINTSKTTIEPDLTVILDSPDKGVDPSKTNPYVSLDIQTDESFYERVTAGYRWEASQRNYRLLSSKESEKDVDIIIVGMVQKLINQFKKSSKPNSESVGQILANRKPAIRPSVDDNIKLHLTNHVALIQNSNDINVDALKKVIGIDVNKKGAFITEYLPKNINKIVSNVSQRKSILAIEKISTSAAYKTIQSNQSVVSKLYRQNLTTDADTGNNFYTPRALKGDVRQRYQDTIKEIVDQSRTIFNNLVDFLDKEQPKARSSNIDKAFGVIDDLMPLACYANLVFMGNDEDIQNLKFNKSLPETISLANRVSKIVDLTEDSKSQLKSSKTNPKLEEDLSHYGDVSLPINLAKVWPHNELEFALFDLYKHSDGDLHSTHERFDSLPYETKMELYSTTIANSIHNLSHAKTAFSNSSYQIDLVDKTSVIELALAKTKFSLLDQTVTPRYGYSEPGVVSEAGLSDEWSSCFDKSLELHSFVQSQGYIDEAEYCVLKGHKARQLLSFSAYELIEAINSANRQKDNELASLLQKLLTTLSDVHPILSGNLGLHLN